MRPRLVHPLQIGGIPDSNRRLATRLKSDFFNGPNATCPVRKHPAPMPRTSTGTAVSAGPAKPPRLRRCGAAQSTLLLGDGAKDSPAFDESICCGTPQFDC